METASSTLTTVATRPPRVRTCTPLPLPLPAKVARYGVSPPKDSLLCRPTLLSTVQWSGVVAKTPRDGGSSHCMLIAK